MSSSRRTGRQVERCTFCEKPRHQVTSLIAGPPGVYICNECIEICNSILQEEQRRNPVTSDGIEAPSAPVRLHLDGVASPMDAELLDQDEQWVTVEQELPFLQIGMAMAEMAQAGPDRLAIASLELWHADVSQ